MIDTRVGGHLEIHAYRPSPGFPTWLPAGGSGHYGTTTSLRIQAEQSFGGSSTKLFLALVISVCNGLDSPDFASVLSDCTVAGEFSAARHVHNCLLRPQGPILEVPAHVRLCRDIGVKVSKVEIEITLLKEGFDYGLKQAWLAGTKRFEVRASTTLRTEGLE